jgi:hypothetical protein
MALVDLIRASRHNPIRRVYIKRRLKVGGYEASWVRVDTQDSVDTVKSWGNITNSIDDAPDADQASFEISDLDITFKNEDGFWNFESDVRSFFYPPIQYLTRKNTRIKIDVGYLDEDGEEEGTATVFEGLINKVTIGEDQLAKVTCLSYISILDSFSIKDLELSGAMTATAIISAIFDQSKVTDFLTSGTIEPELNPSVTLAEELEGTYWDVIKMLALRCVSVPNIVGNTLNFVSRNQIGTPVWNFKGSGTRDPDIFKVNSYDDEGAVRVRLRWEEKGGTLFIESSDPDLLAKYLTKPEEVDMERFNDANTLAVLASLLAYWGNPRPAIEFTTAFLINIVKPLDTITMTIVGRPTRELEQWGSGIEYGDGSTWGDFIGPINIYKNARFMVTSITKNLDDWMTTIRAERV